MGITIDNIIEKLHKFHYLIDEKAHEFCKNHNIEDFYYCFHILPSGKEMDKNWPNQKPRKYVNGPIYP